VARYDAARDRDRREADDADDDAGYERRDRDRESDQNGERVLLPLDVRPGDASVYVDGAFRGTGRELRQLRLTPGRHRVEVVRPGFRTIERDLDVRSGERANRDIDLDRSGGRVRADHRLTGAGRARAPVAFWLGPLQRQDATEPQSH